MKNVKKEVLDLDAALELVAKNLKPLAMKDEDASTNGNYCTIACGPCGTRGGCFDSEE